MQIDNIERYQEDDYLKITHLNVNPWSTRPNDSYVTIVDGLHGYGTRGFVDKLLKSERALNEARKKLEPEREKAKKTYISDISYEAIFKLELEHKPNGQDPNKGKTIIKDIEFVTADKFDYRPPSELVLY